MKFCSFVFVTAFGAMSAVGAQAAIVEGSDVCGELPNTKWSWSITSSTITSGGEADVDANSQTKVAGNNTFLVETTTTTIAPTYTTINTICNALNPQGKINLDHSTTVIGEPVMTDPGSTTTTSTNTKVCGPNLEPC